MSRISRWHGRFPRAPLHDQRKGGWYFITLVVDGRIPLMGKVVDRSLRLTPIGEIANSEWSRTALLRYEVELGPFVVMPDHFHALIRVASHGDVGALDIRRTRHPNTIGSIIAGFKATTTRQINLLRKSPGSRFWQTNYHDSIVRNRKSWDRIARYILENPAKLIYGP